MLSLTKDENRQKQAKLGALVATAALATTFAGATAVHADTVGSAPQPAGQVHKTSQTVGFESAAGSTGASTATSTGKVSSSAVASNAQSGAGSSAASGSTAKSDAKSNASSAASSVSSSSGSQSGASNANLSASSSNGSSAGSSETSGAWVNTDVEKHVVRTVRITTPNGRTQDYTQTVKLTRTKSEKDGKVVYSAWTDGEWKAFPLVPIDGYNWMINGQEYAPQKDANGKYKAEELPSVKVTDQTGDSLVTVTYKKIGSTTDNKDQGSDTNSNAGSSATNSSTASGSNESGQGSNGSSVNDGKTATNSDDASTTTTAGLGDVMANGANAGTVTTTASPAGTVNGVSASAPAGAVIGSGAKAGQLPQTGAQSEAGLAALGVAGMLAALGVSKVGKKREA